MKKLKETAYVFLFLLALCMLIGPNLLKATGPKEPPQALTENERFIYETIRAAYAEIDTVRDTARAGLDSADVAYNLADSARDSANAAYLLADSAQDSAAAAYTLAGTAQDTGITAMDTAAAAYDSVLAAGLPYVTTICDTTADTVQVQALRVCEDMFVNYDGPDGDSRIYFWENNSPTDEYIGWNETSDKFWVSDQLDVAADLVVWGDGIIYGSGGLSLTYDLDVNGNDIDIGDAGGFSGIKFDPSSTQLEFWIDGVQVGHIGTDGAYVDDI
jgi:hypothetical protein